MRFVRGLFALAVLLVGVIGVPYALFTLGGNPLPSRLDGAAIARALFRPDDGTVLIGLITIVGWAAWLVFALSVLTELVATLSRQRIQIRLPGLGSAQRVAGVLIVLVVAMLVLHPNATGHKAAAQSTAPPSPGNPRSAPLVPQAPTTGVHQQTKQGARTGSATPVIRGPESLGSTGGSTSSHPARTGGGATRAAGIRVPTEASAPSTIHVVQPGDELWTLAEHYYGHGREWRQIARANPQLLSGGPDRLTVGWRLVIPGSATAKTASDRDAVPSVRVVHGDTLASIADQEYGDVRAWPGLFEANHATIADPDEIVVGELIELPARLHTQAGTFTRLGYDTAERSSSDSGADQLGSTGSDRSAPAGSTQPEPTPTTPTPAQPSPGQPSASQPSASTGSRPTVAAPSEAAPSEAAPSEAAPSASAPPAVSDFTPSDAASPIVLAGIGGLLAAGLIGGLAARRRIQLQSRPVGRRIAHAPAPAQLTEAQLGSRQTPLGLATLDLALRAVGLHSLQTGQLLPLLQAATVETDRIELIFAETPGGLLGPDGRGRQIDPPTGLRAVGSRWLLDAADAGYLAKLPGINSAAQPYPALTPVGVDLDDVQLLVNLEATGLLALDDLHGPDHSADAQSGMLRAMAAALAFSPWSEEVVVSVVGGDADLDPGLVEAVGTHTLTHSDDLDRLLDRWEQRAATQRRHLVSGPANAGPILNRVDPDLADPWVPEIALIDQDLRSDQLDRLERVVLSDPPVTMAAVVRGSTRSPWRIRPAERHSIDEPGAMVELWPLGWSFAPQLLSAEVSDSLRALIAASGSELTTPAPWWNTDDSAGQVAGATERDATGDLQLDGAPLEYQASPAIVGDGTENWSAQTTQEPADDLSEIFDPTAPDNVRPASDGLMVEPDETSPAPRRAAAPSGSVEPALAGTENLIPFATPRLNPQVDPSAGPLATPHSRGAGSPAHSPASFELAPSPSEPSADIPVVARRGWPSSPVPRAAFTDPANNVTFIAPVGRRVASEESATVDHPTAADLNPVRHPTVRLLGPIELAGAAGPVPPRAAKQCIEYCTWLLEHPGRSAREMANALVVAEGTRRSNVSRLRAWLGEDSAGEPYLPDAYSGRIMLSPVVSSDWHRLQILTGPGVNATSTDGLYAALRLVRGAPLADAAPGQWHWAEEMRTDMVSVIRDIGVELSRRALDDRDLELARWATARSLTAAPHDERLMTMRIRIEHRAGNPAEVERLSLQMSAHARLLGLDLDPETVDLLQQVMEGQVRARA